MTAPLLQIPERFPDAYLAGRSLLITGAGSGRGAALAKALGRLGAEVLLLGRSLSGLEAVYDEIEAKGGQSSIFVMDLETAGPEAYEQLTELIEQEIRKLDGLVFNAGLLGERVPLQTCSVDTWYRVMQVNLHSSFILLQQLLPLMMQSNDASILFTSSDLAKKGQAYWGAYAVSRAAGESLAGVLAEELAETSKIRVNSINPGRVRSAFAAAAWPGLDPESLAEPEALLLLYIYLLGPDARGITGQSLSARNIQVQK